MIKSLVRYWGRTPIFRPVHFKINWVYFLSVMESKSRSAEQPAPVSEMK